MARFLAGLFIVLVLALCAIYAAGWLNFEAGENKATIEVETGKMKEAAEDAGAKAQELIKDSQRAIEDATSGATTPPTP